MMRTHKPVPLKRGDKIGIFAPSGAVNSGQLNEGVSAIQREGFEVVLAEGILQRKGYLAGEKELRAKSLEQLFERDDVRAIFCARGGFGTIQLLPLLNPAIIRSHPKIFVGYSDVSLLLNWLIQTCGLVTFHGPMVAMDVARGLKGRSRDLFWETLCGASDSWFVGGIPICPGQKGVEGEMVGGCLSVVVTTLGTPYELQTKGKILFLEDVGEKIYRIERMLTHLKMAGKLSDVAGVVLGEFTDCELGGARGLTEVMEDLFQDVNYPVVSGISAGHGQENLLLPFGVKMVLDGGTGSLSLMESPTGKP